MGPGTYAVVKEHIEARELDWVRVSGQDSGHVAMYELLAMRGELSADRRKVVDLYGQALVAYRARKFNQAKALSGHALEVDEGDGPSRRLFGLCAQFEVYPPPEGWDGVSELENQELKS